MNRPATPEAQSEPNVIPLIDVLLVLLVIFFTIHAIEQAKEAEERKVLFAHLPETVASPGVIDLPSIVLEVTPEGYRVNRAPVAEAALSEYLREIYDARPVKVLFVKGDSAVRYQEIITAMDIARGAGVRVFGVPPTQ